MQRARNGKMMCGPERLIAKCDCTFEEGARFCNVAHCQKKKCKIVQHVHDGVFRANFLMDRQGPLKKSVCPCKVTSGLE